jgi:hypothetical protein
MFLFLELKNKSVRFSTLQYRRKNNMKSHAEHEKLPNVNIFCILDGIRTPPRHKKNFKTLNRCMTDMHTYTEINKTT